MTSEQIYESYGYKAYAGGFFNQWRMETATIIKNEPLSDRAENARMTYERIHKQKVSEQKDC